MTRRDFVTGAALAAMPSRSEFRDPQSAIQIAAYYFPNYHPDPRNAAWHGKGWTEWELVKAARPRFRGHLQPKVPAWGCFDESDPAWAAREIDLAADHGIDTFIYDWYWYEDGPYLEDGLQKGFLRAANNARMKFAIMWANHDWTNIHPSQFINHPETLAKGRVSREAFERLTDHVVESYFKHPSYWKVDDLLFFSIYELFTFIDGLGGLERAAEAIKSFRAKVEAARLPGLHVNAILWGVTRLDIHAVVSALKIDSIGSYAWVHDYNPDSDGFPRSSYAKAAERCTVLWEEHRSALPVPYHPNVSVGWDPSPRTIQTDRYEARGYPWTAVLEGNTPTSFHQALERAKAHVSRPEVEQKVITLNAWNEWTEGSYLLPDKAHGTAYLEAIREVFGKRSRF